MPTLIFEDKFETGGTWNVSAGSPTIVGPSSRYSPPPSGGNVLQCDAIGDYVYWDIPNSGYTRCVFGVWVQWDSFPTSAVTRIFKIDSGPCEGWFRQISSGSGEPDIVGDGTPTMASASAGTNLSTDTWTWCQLMFDVSTNPWQLQAKVGTTVWQTTGAAAASNLDAGIFLLGNTTGGNTLNVYFGHAKAGVAADDNDWWDEPTGSIANAAWWTA